MADVFVSYKRSDSVIVGLIVEGLREAGFSVWWDAALVGGDDFSLVTAKELEAARVVMPIWSDGSVQSQWVRAEAYEGGGKLFPVRIDEVKPPLPHAKIQTTDLTGWTGDRSDPRWTRLVSDLGTVLNTAPHPAPLSKPQRRSVPLTFVGVGALTVLVAAIAMFNLTGRQPASSGASPATMASADVASAPASTTTGLQLDLCRATGDRACGLKKVHLGEFLQVRLVSPSRGRLLLIDQSADGEQVQIFPNGQSPAGFDVTVEPGTTLLVPAPEHEFEFVVGGPVGKSSLMAVIQPVEVQWAGVVDENRKNRGIVVIPKSRRAEVAEATAQARSGANGAFAELAYEVVP